MTTKEEIKALKEEIKRLKDLLRANGIPVPEKEFANHLPFSQEPTGKKSLNLPPIFLCRRKCPYFKVYSRGGKMYLREDGSAIKQVKAVINLCA